MKMCFRWYGSDSDPIPLNHIKQIPGVSGVMGLIDSYLPGDVWTDEAVRAYVAEVHAAGLEVEVIESVKVHEAIKQGRPERDFYIDHYKQTVRHLARHGVKVIIYDFMPVFDWVRTDLAFPLEDGSHTMYYDGLDLQNISPQELLERMRSGSGGFTLAGWEPSRMAELDVLITQYETIDEARLLENFKYFLDEIMPVCEEVGLRMALHPDDPAWPIFGIPRIAHSRAQFDEILALNDSKSHCLCLCTGSLGSNPENDVAAIIRHFGESGRLAAVHVRNVKHLAHLKFMESSHFSTDGSLDMVAIMKAIYETAPDVYIRPDHGRMIWDEKGRPGYGLYDRGLGVAYLNGIWETLSKLDAEATVQ